MSIGAALAVLGAVGALGVAPVAGATTVPDPPVVEIDLVPSGSAPAAMATVDGLADGDVLEIVVRDGPPDTSGSVAQCALAPRGVAECRNRLPVVLDHDGRARFQYQVRERTGCATAMTCAVHVAVGDREGDVVTVFGPAAPPPAIALSPSRPVAPGSSVVVTVGGLAPGSPVRIAFCAASCGGVSTSLAAADGTTSVTVAIPRRCDDCGIAVLTPAARRLVPVTFTAPPAAHYDLRRLVAGLGLAAVLLLAAWRIVGGVDWRPPSEAAIVDPPP